MHAFSAAQTVSSPRSAVGKVRTLIGLAAATLLLAACAAGGGRVVSDSPNLAPLAPVYNGVATGSPRRLGFNTGPVKAALLIPQTGRPRDQLALGRALFEAAQLALFESGRSDISLVVKNTGGGPGSAAAAAERAIAEGADIILGPVFAEDVSAVRAVASASGVPVIAFSSDVSVAGNGVFLLSFPPEAEIRAIVGYAAAQGYRAYASLSSSNAYGRRAAQTYASLVAEIGGTLVAQQSFASGNDYNAVMGLSGLTFDTLFVPAGGQELRQITALLRFGPQAAEPQGEGMTTAPPPAVAARAELPAYILLGTGLWDEPANATAGGLTGGYFAAPEPGTRENFGARFEAAYGYRAPRIASLGYDAVNLAATLAGAGRITRDAVADPNGFAGVDGIFRFRPDGTIDRGLAIIETTGQGFRVVRGAPITFEAAGF